MAWKWEDGFVGGFIFIFTSQKTPHVSSVCLHLRIYCTNYLQSSFFILYIYITPHVSSVCLHLRIYPGLYIYIYIPKNFFFEYYYIFFLKKYLFNLDKSKCIQI
jgi:hypothetical protein